MAMRLVKIVAWEKYKAAYADQIPTYLAYETSHHLTHHGAPGWDWIYLWSKKVVPYYVMGIKVFYDARPLIFPNANSGRMFHLVRVGAWQ